METLGYEVDMNAIMTELHPSYELTNDRDFVKQLYRLEGFVHLRNHQEALELQEGIEDTFSEQQKGINSMLLLSAAESF